MSDPNTRRRLLYFYVVGNGRDYTGRLSSWLPRLSGVPDSTLSFVIDDYIRRHQDFNEVLKDTGENMLRDMFIDEKFIGILNDDAKRTFFEITVDDVIAVLYLISAKGKCKICSRVTDNGSCGSCGPGSIVLLFPEMLVLARSIDKNKTWFSRTLRQAQGALQQRTMIA